VIVGDVSSKKCSENPAAAFKAEAEDAFKAGRYVDAQFGYLRALYAAESMNGVSLILLDLAATASFELKDPESALRYAAAAACQI
jgi:hypothetical protein